MLPGLSIIFISDPDFSTDLPNIYQIFMIELDSHFANYNYLAR